MYSHLFECRECCMCTECHMMIVLSVHNSKHSMCVYATNRQVCSLPILHTPDPTHIYFGCLCLEMLLLLRPPDAMLCIGIADRSSHTTISNRLVLTQKERKSHINARYYPSSHMSAGLNARDSFFHAKKRQIACASHRHPTHAHTHKRQRRCIVLT